MKEDPVTNTNQVRRHCLWYNKYIKIGNSVQYNERILLNGLWLVGDLYENGNLINFDIWKERGLTENDHLLWAGIVSAIPRSWKLLLQNNENDHIFPKGTVR